MGPEIHYNPPEDIGKIVQSNPQSTWPKYLSKSHLGLYLGRIIKSLRSWTKVYVTFTLMESFKIKGDPPAHVLDPSIWVVIRLLLWSQVHGKISAVAIENARNHITYVGMGPVRYHNPPCEKEPGRRVTSARCWFQWYIKTLFVGSTSLREEIQYT